MDDIAGRDELKQVALETDDVVVLFLDAAVVHFAPSANTADLATVRACLGNTCGQAPAEPPNADLSVPNLKVTVTGSAITATD